MLRNIAGLKRSARLRSEQAMDRALAALHRMDASDREINFRTVASEAKVSTAWLYGQNRLREVKRSFLFYSVLTSRSKCPVGLSCRLLSRKQIRLQAALVQVQMPTLEPDPRKTAKQIVLQR